MLETFFSPIIYGAIFGSIIGSVWAYGWSPDSKHGGIKRFIVESLLAALGAAAIAEQFLIYRSFWSAALVGSGIGLLWGRVLEIINALGPAILERAINNFITKVFGVAIPDNKPEQAHSNLNPPEVEKEFKK